MIQVARDGCQKKYNLHFLSLYIDGALKFQHPIEEHVKNCTSCKFHIKLIHRLEEQIREYEKTQENFVLFEIFDTVQQCRNTVKLAWYPLFLGLDNENRLQQSTITQRCIKLYLHQFWYGQIAVYLENISFPLRIHIQRGKRYIPIKSGDTKRIIEKDSLLILNDNVPISKITFRIPRAFKENSITRKYKSLALGSSSFIQRFFQKTPEIPVIQAWEQIKLKLSVRDKGIYLTHLNTDLSYQRIAKDFKTVPSHVGKIIVYVRKKLMSLCLEK